MIVKLNKEQIEYLNSNLFTQNPSISSKLIQEHKYGYIYITLDDDIADEIRDWAGEQLQLFGFNVNDELTSKGELLEKLIDIFYTE